MAKIILLSGKMGSGKTTLATELERALKNYGGKTVRIFKFAGPLYAMQNALRQTVKEYGIPFETKERRLLQMLGTWGREVKGINVWVDAVKYQINLSNVDFGIIDDCRFENEFNAFPQALKVRLIADVNVRAERTESFSPVEHESETGLDAYEQFGKFDLVLRTDKLTIDETLSEVLKKFL